MTLVIRIFQRNRYFYKFSALRRKATITHQVARDQHTEDSHPIHWPQFARFLWELSDRSRSEKEKRRRWRRHTPAATQKTSFFSVRWLMVLAEQRSLLCVCCVHRLVRCGQMSNWTNKARRAASLWDPFARIQRTRWMHVLLRQSRAISQNGYSA